MSRSRRTTSAGALAAFEESLADRSAAWPRPTRPTAEWQRDISVALDKIGYLKFSAKDSAGALAAYEESLAITRRLADARPDNIIWQRDVAVGLNKVGDVKFFWPATPRARLRPMRRAWRIARRLAEANNREMPRCQRDLSFSLDKIGDVKRARRHCRRARGL